MKNHFSHLHVHSEYSILKGTSSVEKWYRAAERRNISAIAFTEWNNMGSAMESFLESRKIIENHEMKNVKAIFGLQILVVQELESSVQEDNIILLANNERGYKNLMKLSKFSYTNGFDISRQTARVDFETLHKYSKGIFCLSGSLSGPIAVSLEAGYSIAEEAFLQLREIYGKRLFLEIQMNEFEEQKKLNNVLFSLSKKYKNKCVLTNDCHYINKDEDKLAWFVNEIFKHSGKYIKRSNNKIGTQKWLKSYKQLDAIRRRLHGYITESMFHRLVDNTNAVADDCNVTIPIGEHILPNYEIETHPLYKDGMKDGDELFEYIAKKGFKDKVKTKIKDKKELKKYKKRFDFELDFIKDKAKFSNYFLIVDDIIKMCEARGIERGGARGCLIGRTPIVLKDGVKKIKDVEIGDRVVNKYGKQGFVKNKFVYNIDEDICYIKSYRTFNKAIGTTLDHIYYGQKSIKNINCDNPKKAKWIKPNDDIVEIKAKDLEIGDLIWTPFIKRRKDKIKNIRIDLSKYSDKYCNVENCYIEEKIPINKKYHLSIKSVQEKTGLSRNFLVDTIRGSKFKTNARRKLKSFLKNYDMSINDWIKHVNKNKYITQKINRYFNIDIEEAWIIGRWISDGWLLRKTERTLSICFGENKKKHFKRFMRWIKSFGIINYNVIKIKKIIQVDLHCGPFVRFWRELFSSYDFNSKTKYIPKKLFKLSSKILLSLRSGLEDGDSYQRKNVIVYSTASERLAYDYKRLNLILKTPVSIHIGKQRDNKHLNSESKSIEYKVCYYVGDEIYTGSTYIKDDGYFSRIYYKKIKREKIRVYDLEIDNEHSFLTLNGTVHNSVAGSLVAYCIITDIDPLKFDLMFERFLNPTRVKGSYPDIDLDVSKIGRPIVKGYIEDKYGKNNVCTIGTYGTMKVKSLIRDAQRVFEGELPVDENKRVAFDVLDMNKLLKDLGDETKLEKAYESDLFKKYAKKFPYLVDFYFKRLEGQIRNLSKHAAGILITPTNISNWIPVRTQKLEDETNRVLVSQWKDSHCEKRGLIKFDILGIKTLDVFKYAKKIIKKMDGVDIDFSRDVDLTDKKVIKKFDKGETDGVFQFNSEIQSAYLSELKVKSFEDLIVTNAILRPGPMDVDSHKKYIELTTGKRKPKYTHKLVKPYMKKTLGLYAFQEDVMRTANVLGKLTLAEADIMRTAMKKKDKDMMKQFEDKFVQGCIENGLTKKKAKKEWKKLEAFFAYGFNRCIHKSSMITLADGRQETILRLFNKHKAGQEIWLLSWDTETKKIVQHKVKEVVYSGRRSVGKLFLEDGNNLMLTTRHGVGTKRGFRLFYQLRKDDDVRCLIRMPNHFEMSISKIDSEKTYYEERYKEEVYDIVMEDNGPRNFFANGILVHNSHSVSYAFNGFICQWLKVYYPLPFWTATLEYAKDNPKDKENVWSFRNVIQQEGIEFEKPKATRYRHDFHISKEGKIVWPIKAIKGIGEKTAKVIAKACKENKPKTFAEFYEVIPRKSVNKRVVDKLIMADAFSEFGHPKKIAKEYYLELRKEKDIPEHFKVSKKDKKYWMEMKDETLGYLEEPYRKRYSHFFNKKITPISQLKNIRNGSPVIAGGKISRIYPYKTKRGMMYFINVFDADGQFLLLIFGGFDQKNKKVKKLKEGDIVEVLGVRSVSNRGELEVVLRDDRISQLEVLEDI